jgi:hypothetical protein
MLILLQYTSNLEVKPDEKESSFTPEQDTWSRYSAPMIILVCNHRNKRLLLIAPRYSRISVPWLLYIPRNVKHFGQSNCLFTKSNRLDSTKDSGKQLGLTPTLL